MQGTLFLRLLVETGSPFFVVIWATRRSCRLRGKDSAFISHLFKILSIGPTPGIKPATSRSAVKRSIDLANPAAFKKNTERKS